MTGFDFENLSSYREDNRLEAKTALGGLPHSLWETYSAFANAEGGLILLGVRENLDKSLTPVKLPDPEKLIAELFELASDPRVASVNLLNKDNVYVKEVDDCRIIVIEVPKAKKEDYPVYVGGDPIRGAYFRDGEGDYRLDALPSEKRSVIHPEYK